MYKTKRPRDSLKKICFIMAVLLSCLSVSVFAESTESIEITTTEAETVAPTEIEEKTEVEYGPYSGLEVVYVTDAADLLPGSALRERIAAAPYEVRLTCDIAFTEEQSAQMKPIYLADGTCFDGRGYAISGWNYTGTKDWQYFGMFLGNGNEGTMKNVKICNLSIIDCTFTFTEAAANGTTGIVCPTVGNGCKFYNIYTNAIVHSYGNSRSCSVFGVVGNGAQAVVEYCQFDGEINSADIAPAFFRGVWANDTLTMRGCLMTGLLIAKGQQVDRGVFVAQMLSSATFEMSECYSIYGSLIPLWGSELNIVGNSNEELSREEMIGVEFLDRMNLNLSLYGPTVDKPPVLRIASGKGTVRAIDEYLDVQAMSHMPYTGQSMQQTASLDEGFGNTSFDILKKAAGVLAIVILGVGIVSVFTPKKKAHWRKK
jgi:hypothetical protein